MIVLLLRQMGFCSIVAAQSLSRLFSPVLGYFSSFFKKPTSERERFSLLGGKRITAKWGKLFWCPVCHYEANADYNASANVHHSFYHEWHWQPRKKATPQAVPSG